MAGRNDAAIAAALEAVAQAVGQGFVISITPCRSKSSVALSDSPFNFSHAYQYF